MSGLFNTANRLPDNFKEKILKTMKTHIAFAILLVTINSYSQTNLEKLDWLNGEWSRTNAKPGRSGFEIWKKNSDKEMTGRGINLKGTDTTFVEKLKIIVKDEAIYYVADVPENKEPVLFKLTSQSASTLVFENPKHDFPKKISYELSGKKLKATISGDCKAMEYLFERK
jgi:Domain of unknown function (DUF6265)